tara:strand:+ start:101 stop:772 length:672 start_codon:yes stop_codon:yes gene_type:complete
MIDENFIKFIVNLKAESVPQSIQILDPYSNKESVRVTKLFYKKFFNDHNKRILLFGINPGRLGGGLTGIPFTDPYHLEKSCGISTKLDTKKELSSTFIYEMIDMYGGPKLFYEKFLVTSICPYGFTREGKNLNYYDEKRLEKKWRKKIIEWIETQKNLLSDNSCCVVIGKGKNQKFFEMINKEYKFFNHFITLPHPRWVLQYKMKNKNEYLEEYITKLSKIKL